MSEKVAVIGLGYVGLPLLNAFSNHFNVVGFDLNQQRILELKNGFDRTGEIELLNNNIFFTDIIEDCKDCNIFIVTVPTPIDHNNLPDFDPLTRASKSIAQILKINDIVVYESTVYPGATREYCVPVLETYSNLSFNKDFFVGYSPERINPSDRNNKLENIVKVVSASNESTLEILRSIYSTIIHAGIHLASSIEVAEAAKILENTQRDVNIALMNEFSRICTAVGIKTNDVLEAASTKWNFVKFYPGLVGGHCIGVDPYYLAYRANQLDVLPDIITTSRKVNNSMPKFIVEKILKDSIQRKIDLSNSNALILGFSFKPNCPDIRNTKVFDIYSELSRFNIPVDVYDPLVNSNEVLTEYGIHLLNNIENKKYNILLLAVPHIDYLDTFKNILNVNAATEHYIFDVNGILSDDYNVGTL